MKSGSIPFPVIAATILAIGLSACSRNSKTDDAGTPETETVKNAATVRSDREPRSRKFRLDYGFTLKGLPAGAKVRVWMPVPPSNRQQTVAELDRLLPASASIATEPTHGNRIMYLEPTSPATGVLKFRVSYRVTRREVQALSSPGKPHPLSPRQRRLAHNMRQGQQKIVPATAMIVVGWDRAEEAARAFRDRRNGVTATPFLLMARCVAVAMRNHPKFRSTWSDSLWPKACA
ncbi:MAG: hypothetical protein IID60_12305 [Proteobacteria bacterium]|nr:hypothetical protein [Pseudomonadota bacterium]